MTDAWETKATESSAIARGYGMSHTCHARGCSTPCPPAYLMCGWHWRKVPAKLQRAVYLHYRSGQCDDMNPSAEWHVAADAAIGAVALLEFKPISAVEGRALEAAGYTPAGFHRGVLVG